MKRKRIKQNKIKLSQRQKQARKNKHPANLYLSGCMSLVLESFVYMEECFDKLRLETTQNISDDSIQDSFSIQDRSSTQDSFEIAFSEPLTQSDMIIAIHQNLQFWQEGQESSASYKLLLEIQSSIERLFPYVRTAEQLKTVDLEWFIWEQISAATADYSLKSCGSAIYKRPETVTPILSKNEQDAHNRQVADFFNRAGITLD